VFLLPGSVAGILPTKIGIKIESLWEKSLLMCPSQYTKVEELLPIRIYSTSAGPNYLLAAVFCNKVQAEGM